MISTITSNDCLTGSKGVRNKGELSWESSSYLGLGLFLVRGFGRGASVMWVEENE